MDDNISSILNGGQIPDNIKNILENMMNNSANNNSNSSSTSSESCESTNSFNTSSFDINTIFKIQNIMNSINNNKENEYRTNLLLSLKPYLKSSKQEKIDTFINLMKMEKVIEAMGPINNINSSNSS